MPTNSWVDIGPAPAHARDIDGYEPANPAIAYNNTRPRYSFSGIIRSGDLWGDVRTQLEQAMGDGLIFERAGVWYIRAGTDRVPSFILGDDDVVAGSVETSPQSEEFFNHATATLSQNRFSDFQKYTLDFTDSEAQAEDGEIKSKNFGALASITDPIQGYRFLRTQFVKNRHNLVLTCTLDFGENLRWLSLLPGDVGRVHLPREGVSNLLLVVEAAPVIDTEAKTIQVILREAHVDTYSDEVELPPLLPRDVSVVDLFDHVPVPEDLQLAERPAIGGDGTVYIEVKGRVRDPNAPIV